MFILTCLKIFAARIVDVTLGTIRTVFFVKGRTIEPFIIAFFEVLVWYIVAREAINTTGNPYLIAVFYAGGYATGTFIGSLISNKFIKGYASIQVITKEDNINLINNLRKKGYAVSVIELKDDYDGKNKDMLYIEVSNKRIKEVTSIVKKFAKDAFLVVNETKLVQNGLLK